MRFDERYGPWALITGASEGTGREFARALAKAGLNCILIARRQAPLEALADDLCAQHGIECIVASVDLSEAGAADEVTTIATGREVGLFISNAGADTNSALFLDQPLRNWVDLVQRNVMTVMRCCHHFGVAMRERGRGGLLLVGSGAAYGGASFMPVYAGTKAFNLCFAEGLWAELRPHGVHVLSLMMNRTDTPAFRDNLARKGIPVPSGLACPEEVVRAALERLPHGPVHNWGLADDQGTAMQPSAASRRERVIAIDSVANSAFKKAAD
jgi:short-subunit dehydrogenase